MDEQEPEREPISPHARMQQLLAIPDKQRSDAEWDELNDLEIKLASVNRQGAPLPMQPRPGGNPNGGRQDQRGGRGGRPNNPGKKFHRRQGRGRPPQ